MKMTTLIKAMILSLLIGFSTSAEALQRQQYSNWCWAAAIQDVLLTKGIPQSQTQVVHGVYGQVVNQPANLHQIKNYLNYNGVFTGQIASVGTPYELQTILARGAKVIAFVNPSSNPYLGHFVVFEGLDRHGRILVGDPADGQIRTYNLEEVYYGWKWSGSLVVP